MTKLVIISIFLNIILFLLYWKTRQKFLNVLYDKKSISTRYGKMTEQFLPFLKDFPYNPENFRFLGNPIDGVQFEDDKIIFIEFKTGKSKLSSKQEKIKELILKKKVSFEEHRLE